MDVIVSKSNEKIKYIKSLNEKKFRQKYNEYYLEGIKVVDELLDMYEKKAMDIVSIAYSYDILKNSNSGMKLYNKINNLKDSIEVLNVDSAVFKTIVDTISTQGVLAVVKNYEKKINDIDISSNIVILDRLQDAGNVGTIIRTALSFDVKNIICVSGSVDVFSQKVLRSTMSAILKVNIINIDENELSENIEYLKNNNYQVIGTALNSNEYINKNLFKLKAAIVIGNESNGISENMSKLCDKLVKIQMSENSESLNASCAASILLYMQYQK